jgi:hypothetical protein
MLPVSRFSSLRSCACGCIALGLSSSLAIDGLPIDYTPIIDGHVDFSFCYADGEWEMGLVHEVGGDPNNPADGTPKSGELAPMIARDQLFPSGSRALRLTAPLWTFLGVNPATPYWYFPEGNWVGVYPGFNVCDIEDAVSYLEPDPRINTPGQWTTVTLRDVDYRGKQSSGGHFSLWTTDSFGQPTVWMSSATNGIDPSDKYYVLSGAHSHPNMGFSALGLYAVTFDLTFYEGPGKTNPNTSPVVAYYFAIGTFWQWIAEHFDPSFWFVNGTVGENDDPDRDGISNLVEYACDLDPTTPDNTPFSTPLGRGLPTISSQSGGTSLLSRFPLRLTSENPQLDVLVESSPSLSSTSWQPSPGTTQKTPLRPGWETCSHSISIANPATQFLRLRISLQTQIPY